MNKVLEASGCAEQGEGGGGEIVEVLRVLGRVWKGLGGMVRGAGYIPTHSELFAILIKIKSIPAS